MSLYISLNLTLSGDQEEYFGKLEDLLAWLEGEIEFHDELSRNLKSSGNQLAGPLLGFFKDIENIHKKFILLNSKNITDMDKYQKWLNKVIEYYEEQSIAHSKTDIRQRIGQYQGDPSFVNDLLCGAFNIDEAIKLVVTDKDTSTENFLVELKKNEPEIIRQDLTQLSEQVEKTIRSNESSRESIDSLFESEALRKEEQNKALKRISDAQAALEDGVALHSASRLWKTKKQQHMTRFNVLVALSFVWLALWGTMLHVNFGNYIENVKGAVDFWDFFPYLPWNIVLVIIAIWGLRIIVRLLLSESHLATKAEEKRALIQTYLALINKGAASKEDRHIILTSIFNLSQDGLVEDDGLPKNLPITSITNI